MDTKRANEIAQNSKDSISAEDAAQAFDNDHPENYRGRVVMESGGVVDMDNPKYVEEDDVMDSIAEGYF